MSDKARNLKIEYFNNTIESLIKRIIDQHNKRVVKEEALELFINHDWENDYNVSTIVSIVFKESGERLIRSVGVAFFNKRTSTIPYERKALLNESLYYSLCHFCEIATKDSFIQNINFHKLKTEKADD